MGLLHTAPAVAFLGELTSGWTGRVWHSGRALIVSVLVWGLAITGSGLSGQLCLLCLAIAGFGDTTSEILRRALLQHHTPDHLQGHVSSLWLAQATSGSAVGNAEAGAAAPVRSVGGGRRRRTDLRCGSVPGRLPCPGYVRPVWGTSMPLAEINGIKINYDDTGDGEPVVLVMGVAASGRVWQLHQVPALVAAGFRAITFDNRGISSAEPGFTIDDLVADTAGLIEHLGLGPCRLVGTSMGAQVVTELMLARPELVSQAVLMATRGRPDAMRSAMSAAERELRDGGLELPAKYEAVVRAVQNLSPRTLNDDNAIQDWLDVFEMSATVWTPGLRAQLRLDIRESRLDAYRAIRVPCLVIGFADDVRLPAYLAREVAEVIPSARYFEIEGCGHYGYLERPDVVNDALVTFFTAGHA